MIKSSTQTCAAQLCLLCCSSPTQLHMQIGRICTCRKKSWETQVSEVFTYPTSSLFLLVLATFLCGHFRKDMQQSHITLLFTCNSKNTICNSQKTTGRPSHTDRVSFLIFACSPSSARG